MDKNIGLTELSLKLTGVMHEQTSDSYEWALREAERDRDHWRERALDAEDRLHKIHDRLVKAVFGA